jgi:hypothetical protein
MTIHRDTHGGRTIVAERNGHTIVSTGHGGYVQRAYLTRNGRNYYQRTYLVGGRSYARVYRGYDYHGVRYYGYVPAHYYRPAFYGWAYNPWPRFSYTPAAWGWAGTPWFGFYAGFFTPFPVYTSASLWLTDYLIAANLQAAYQARPDVNTVAPMPTDSGPFEPPSESGLAYVPVYVPGTATLAQGFSAAGAVGYSSDRPYLGPGGTVSYTFTVAPGQVETVAYGIPTGGYVNSVPAEFAVNGVTATTLTQGTGQWGTTTPTQLLLWRRSFGPGNYVLTIRSGGNYINVYGLWLSTEQEGAQSADQQPGSPETGATAATPLSPELKQAIADEVQQQIAAEKDSAANPQAPPPTPTGGEVPAALKKGNRVFVVASNLDVTMTDNGQECALTAGDVVMRLTESPDANQNVNASIQSSKKGDCASGETVAIGVQDLQEMHNQFLAQFDSGLQQLAENGGKGNLPKAPDTATTAGEVPAPAPDSGAAAQITAHGQQADKTEAQLVN